MEALTSASVALLTVWDSTSISFPSLFSPFPLFTLFSSSSMRFADRSPLPSPSVYVSVVVKAVAGKEMIIEGLMVVRKSGGKSGNWEREL